MTETSTRTENISGIYWAEQIKPRGWYRSMIEQGDGVEAAVIAGVGSEYVLYYVPTGHAGDREVYSLFERATGGPGPRRGATVSDTVKVWHCKQTWPMTREGLATALAYVATVVSDTLAINGCGDHY